LSPQISKNFLLIPAAFFNVLVFGPASAGLVINEFLPDPAGADAGKEFVEFLNTGPGPINLHGLEFQFANGSTGPEWETRLLIEEQKWLAEGDRFLVVDRNWAGEEPFDAEAWLGLQNGPDAIRLVHADAVLDLVGYGALTDVEMMEESAAPMVMGLSILRRPDGYDTNNNSLDFITGQPSPGQVNFQDYEMEVVQVDIEPPSLAETGANVLLEMTLSNKGLLDLGPTAMALVLQNENGGNTTVLETLFSGCQAGETCRLALSMTPARKGRFSIILEFSISDGPEPLGVFLGKLQVGCGAVFLSEALAAPSFHQGEWIEVQAEVDGVNTGEYFIRDEEGDWRLLPEKSLERGQFLVVAQDSAALVAWHRENLNQGLVLDCPADQMNQVLRKFSGTWPSLNNSPPEDRLYADRIYLADTDGVVDHVTLPGDEQDFDFRGKSWERMTHDGQSFAWGRWRSCVAATGGTPGCPNSVAHKGTTGHELEVDPAILDAFQGESICHVRFNLEEGEVGWHVEVFDLWGELIRDLGGADSGPGPGHIIWDTRDEFGNMVASGGYVVLLLKSRDDGIFSPSAKQLVVVR